MSHDEYRGIAIGAFSSPLTASTTNATLVDADPAIAAALAFYAGVLAIHLGARWAAAATLAKLSAAALVGVSVPYDPGPFLTQVTFVMPMLALFPVSEIPAEHTRANYRQTSTWTLQWILPAMTPAQYLQMYPFLRAASKVILARTEQGYDPAYEDGALVCEAGGLASLAVREVRYGRLEGSPRSQSTAGEGSLYFPTLEVDLEAVEQRTPIETDALDGVDADINVKDAAGEETVVEIAETYTP